MNLYILKPAQNPESIEEIIQALITEKDKKIFGERPVQEINQRISWLTCLKTQSPITQQMLKTLWISKEETDTQEKLDRLVKIASTLGFLIEKEIYWQRHKIIDNIYLR